MSRTHWAGRRCCARLWSETARGHLLKAPSSPISVQIMMKYTDAHAPGGGQAVAERPATSAPCPLFWPEEEQHGVRYVPLRADVSEEVAPLVPRLRELAAV